MLKTQNKFILEGGTIDVSWKFDRKAVGFLFIWRRGSFWFWKNYARIPSMGKMNFRAEGNKFDLEVRKLSIAGIKTISRLTLPVKQLSIENLAGLSLNHPEILMKQMSMTTVKDTKSAIYHSKINMNIKSPSIQIKSFGHILPISQVD
jgi:hypothetical protein